MMISSNIRERQVNEFVGHQPIVGQLLLGCMPSHEDTSKRRIASPGFASERATLAFGRIHAESREGNRKNSVVVRHRVGSLRYPSDDRLARQIEAPRTKAYLDACASELQSSGVRPCVRAFASLAGLGFRLSADET